MLNGIWVVEHECEYGIGQLAAYPTEEEARKEWANCKNVWFTFYRFGEDFKDY